MMQLSLGIGDKTVWRVHSLSKLLCLCRIAQRDEHQIRIDKPTQLGNVLLAEHAPEVPEEYQRERLRLIKGLERNGLTGAQLYVHQRGIHEQILREVRSDLHLPVTDSRNQTIHGL